MARLLKSKPPVVVVVKPEPQPQPQPKPKPKPVRSTGFGKGKLFKPAKAKVVKTPSAPTPDAGKFKGKF